LEAPPLQAPSRGELVPAVSAAGLASTEETMSADESYQEALEFAIAQCWADGERHSRTLDDGTEVYAHVHKQGIAWGVNDGQTGFNVKRGIRKDDGTDIAVM
jgi:hypothetical protein